MDLGIQGRTAVVFGSTSGIGLAIAKALDREGANVVITGRREDRAREEAKRLGQAIGMKVDLTSDRSIESLVERVKAYYGPPQIVVLNGGGPPPASAADIDATALRRGNELMLYPMQTICRLVIPAMQASGWGRVLAVGSSGVAQPLPDLAASNTSRSALAALLKTWAAEVAVDGVTVNLLLPGRIDTQRVADLDLARAQRTGTDVDDVRRTSMASIPIGRYGRPEEFADVATFLCSECASYITGIRLRVDGGLVRSW